MASGDMQTSSARNPLEIDFFMDQDLVDLLGADVGIEEEEMKSGGKK